MATKNTHPSETHMSAESEFVWKKEKKQEQKHKQKKKKMDHSESFLFVMKKNERNNSVV
jgi:hypothetical protein